MPLVSKFLCSYYSRGKTIITRHHIFVHLLSTSCLLINLNVISILFCFLRQVWFILLFQLTFYRDKEVTVVPRSRQYTQRLDSDLRRLFVL